MTTVPATDPNPPSTLATAPVGSEFVYLCDTSRRELFMMPTSHMQLVECDRCGVAGQSCFQYLRSDLRLDHLSAADRDAFNAKLDRIAADDAAVLAAQEARDLATQKEIDDRLAAETAKMDADYVAAVAARHALEAANAPQTPTPSTTPATSAAPFIASPTSAAFNVGVAASFTVTTTPPRPASILTSNGAFPGGIDFTDNGDGTATLGGTPAAGTSGTYPLTISANNGVSPSAIQNFVLTIS